MAIVRSSSGSGFFVTFTTPDAFYRQQHVTIQNITTMKLITILSCAALTGIGVFALAVLFGSHAIGSFSLAMMPLFLIGVVRDYTPRQPRWEMHRRTSPFPATQPSRSVNPMKLAA